MREVHGNQMAYMETEAGNGEQVSRREADLSEYREWCRYMPKFITYEINYPSLISPECVGLRSLTVV